MKQLQGNYKFKNRRITIRQVTTPQKEKAYEIHTKRLIGKEIIKHTVVYSEDTLQALLYSLKLFLKEEKKL